MINNDVIKKKLASYRKSFQMHGVGPRALQWKNSEAALLRYKQILADIDCNNQTILDVGCGFADIFPLIKKRAKNFSYTGVDIVPEFIDKAKALHPEGKFMVLDYFNNPLKKKFGIVITSGTLNAASQDMSYRFYAIKTIFNNAKVAAVFNMAGGYPQPENRKGGKVFFADSLEVFKYCLSLTSKIIFRHHYHKRDFTITLFK